MTRSAVAAGEERILSRPCMRPDDAFDRVRVHFDAAVVKYRDQAGPVAYGVTYGLGQVGGTGDPIDVIKQPVMQGFDDRSTSLLSDPSSVLGRLSTYLCRDRVERGDTRQHLGREWRLG